MLAIVIALYGLAAALPIAGFARLLIRSQAGLNRAKDLAAQRGHNERTMGDVGELIGDIYEPYRGERNALIWDIALVGTGLIAGAVASIWSLAL